MEKGSPHKVKKFFWMTVRLPPNGSKPVEKPETKNAGGDIDIGPGFFL